MTSYPSGWRGTLALIVLGLFAARLLILAVTPVLPWLVIGLAGGGGLAVMVYVLVRRGMRW